MHIVQYFHFMGGPYVVTLLNWTHILEWYKARFVVHDTPKRHQCMMRVDYVLLKMLTPI